jgi:hypothetical protein
MEKAAQRNAAREARLAAPNGPRSGLRTDSTPSPAASDNSGALPFSIPLQPAPKAGRSMSHSQGQREVVTGPNDHTVLPLGLLAEEVDTESESELGGALTHTTSHPPIGTLQRTSTFPSTYESFYSATNGKEASQAAGGAQGLRGDHRLEAAFAHLSLGKFPWLVFGCYFATCSSSKHLLTPTFPPFRRPPTSSRSVAKQARLGRRSQRQRISSPLSRRHTYPSRLLSRCRQSATNGWSNFLAEWRYVRLGRRSTRSRGTGAER